MWSKTSEERFSSLLLGSLLWVPLHKAVKWALHHKPLPQATQNSSDCPLTILLEMEVSTKCSARAENRALENRLQLRVVALGTFGVYLVLRNQVTTGFYAGRRRRHRLEIKIPEFKLHLLP